ncbi:MAG: hypothetical protein O2848_02125, partial [Proteobacteria bacterium]|nr:hypothetical protein [Pseudomonadota bacterium]
RVPPPDLKTTTATNLLGIQASSRLQSVLLAVAISGLLVLVAVGFSSPAVQPSLFGMPWFDRSPPMGLLGLAMVFVLLTFGG